MVMPDEILDLYGFLFCQRGFRQSGLTFEQFLRVILTLDPGRVRANTHGRETDRVFGL